MAKKIDFERSVTTKPIETKPAKRKALKDDSPGLILSEAIRFTALDLSQIEIIITQVAPSLAQQKLAQHMAILQTYGYSDLAELGTLRLGASGTPKTILQRHGVVLALKSRKLPPMELVPLEGVATRAIDETQFVQLATRVARMPVEPFQVIDSTIARTIGNTKAQTTSPKLVTNIANQKTTGGVVPIDAAYWFANDIVLENDTTVVIASGVKSVFIIANNLTIGSNVTFTWDRPKKQNPSPLQKPPAQGGFPTATTIGSNTGHQGRAGYDAGPGGSSTSADFAPEIELWFLSATGFPAIDLRGQDGMVGIAGGPGGDGGTGQEGCPSKPTRFGLCDSKNGAGGKGGDGGRGGNGGQGNNGGMGGKFSVFAPQNQINNWLAAGLTISVDGGSAGFGGEGGAGGNGGQGGQKGVITNGKCGDSDRHDGATGYAGSAGSRGPDGQKGEMQPHSIRYTPISEAEFIIEANKPAIVSCNPAAAFVGDNVTVNGFRFIPGDRVFCENFDGQITKPCTTTFIANGLLQFIVPEVPGGYASIQVVQADGTRSNVGTLLIRPRINSVVPAGRVRPGETYFLKGTGFGRAGTIWMNNEQTSSFTMIDNNTIKFIARRPTNIVANEAGESALMKVVNSEGVGPLSFNHSPEISVVLDTFRMMIFGDSVMWGGGLYEHEKYYSLAASYLTSKLHSIGMYKTVKAHHGASIGAGETTVKPELPGELSTIWPTITQQVASVSNMPGANEVDMVLIDGGANDLPITGFMLKTTPNQLTTRLADLISETYTYCYTHMKDLLQIVAGQHPKAKIIVTGYYHIFSAQSNLSSANAIALALMDDDPITPDPASVTANKLTVLCDAWVLHSNQNLANAVADVNAGLIGDPRVYFVDPQTTPSNAAHATNSFLWEPDPDVTTLGGPTDPLWLVSRQADREIHKSRLEDEASSMGNRYKITRRNSSYHPNVAGAQNYFNRMKPVLDNVAKSQRVALKASNGFYAGAEGGGGGVLIANRPNLSAWEVFDLVELSPNQIALRAANGLYVSAVGGGGSTVLVNKPRIGSAETFTRVPIAGGGVSFQAQLGQFLTSNSVGLLSATGASAAGASVFREL